jgi:OmpA-OmpF porin, OOP family
MNRTTFWGLAFVSLCVALPAQAADGEVDMRPYISELLTYTFADSDRQSDDAWGGYLGYGRALNQFWGLELGAFYSRFPNDPPGDRASWREYGANLDALFFYSRDPRFSPYFAYGFGVMNSKRKILDPESGTDLFAHVGAGFTTLITDWIGIRGDVRYRLARMDRDFGFRKVQEPILRLGIHLPLGPRVAAVAPPADPAWIDSDGDGVPDHLDECPGTPRGVRVDARGCPIDSDGDGVPDYLDKCPGTPPGTPVDKDGCPLPAAFEKKFEDVNFGFDRHDLTDYARVTLDKTAAELQDLIKRYPKLRVQLDGHTDSIGPESYNMGLGHRRANTVRDYLIRKGIDSQRIATRSFGESRPIASNETPKGRLLNRRTEIRAHADDRPDPK